MTKDCTKCGATKALSEFPRAKRYKAGVMPRCRACVKSAQAESDTRYRPDRLLYARSANLLKRYGISVSDYDEMLLAQDGVCAICRKAEMTNRVGTPLFVDHDHVTGEVRGLLCHYCNMMLGNAKDNPDLLYAAITYLGDN
jgi:hypothetical protein